MGNSEDLFREKVMETAERVAALEKDSLSFRSDLVSLKRDMKEIEEPLNKLLRKLDRWEGKFGAFAFVGICIWTFLTAFWSQIIAFFKFYFTNPS